LMNCIQTLFPGFLILDLQIFPEKSSVSIIAFG